MTEQEQYVEDLRRVLAKCVGQTSTTKTPMTLEWVLSIAVTQAMGELPPDGWTADQPALKRINQSLRRDGVEARVTRASVSPEGRADVELVPDAPLNYIALEVEVKP